MKVHHWFGLFAFGALLSFAGVAQANPELQVELRWQGMCDDSDDLVQQVRARGAELQLRDAAAFDEPAAAHAVRVAVTVKSSAASAQTAEIQLQSEEGQESRRVQASTCGGLRSAVAWVLVVLAQQRAPERRAARTSEREGSAAAFPDMPSDPSARSATSPLAFVPAETFETRPTPAQRAPAHPKQDHAGHWALGTSFTVAFGLVPAPAFGPMLFGRYRSDARWLPTLQLSVQRLVTFGFESNGTTISLTRDVARLGAWVPLVGRVVSLGFAAEAGRLVATGSGSTLEHGSSDSAFWFAFAAPLRVSMPLIGRHLQAEALLELDYSPVPYTFRYGSGDTLTSTAAFEGRGQVGLVSFF